MGSSLGAISRMQLVGATAYHSLCKLYTIRCQYAQLGYQHRCHQLYRTRSRQQLNNVDKS